MNYLQKVPPPIDVVQWHWWSADWAVRNPRLHSDVIQAIIDMAKAGFAASVWAEYLKRPFHVERTPGAVSYYMRVHPQ